MPPLTEDLVVMDDLYLGFKTSTPTGGYQVYGGVGTFDQDLTLNGGGLQGGGKLDFRTAHAESDRFVLLPDSTKGLAQVFTNREAAGPPPVPDVQGEGVQVLFEPRSTRISARPLTRNVIPLPGIMNNSAIRGSRIRLRNVSIRLLPRRSRISILLRSTTRTNPAGSPRGEQSRPSGPDEATTTKGDFWIIRR